MQTRSGGVSTLRSFSLGSPLPFYQASRRELSTTPTAPNHALAGARCSAIRDLETALCAIAAPAAARPVRSLGRSSSLARLFLLIFCRARSCLLRPGKQKGSPDCPRRPCRVAAASAAGDPQHRPGSPTRQSPRDLTDSSHAGPFTRPQRLITQGAAAERGPGKRGRDKIRALPLAGPDPRHHAKMAASALRLPLAFLAACVRALLAGTVPGRADHHRHVPRRSAHPLEVLPRVQPGLRCRVPGLVGLTQGHRCRRDRGFHPPRLVAGTAQHAGSGGARPAPPQARPRRPAAP